MTTEMSRRERLIQVGQEANQAWKADGGWDHEDAVTWIVDTVAAAVDAEYQPLVDLCWAMVNDDFTNPELWPIWRELDAIRVTREEP